MRKFAFFFLLLGIAFSISLGNPMDFVPTDIGFVAYAGNFSSVQEDFMTIMKNQFPPMISQFFTKRQDAFFLVFGNVILQENTLELGFLKGQFNTETLIQLIAQPIAIVTNLFTFELADSFLETQLQEYFSGFEPEKPTTFVKDDVQVKKYPLRSVDSFPPLMKDIFVFELDGFLVVCTQEQLLNRIFAAVKNDAIVSATVPVDDARASANQRLNTVSPFYSQSFARMQTAQMVVIMPSFPLIGLALRAWNTPVGIPGGICFSVDLPTVSGTSAVDSLKLDMLLELGYQSSESKAWNVSQNLSLQSLLQAPAFAQYPLFLHSRPSIFNYSWLLEQIESFTNAYGTFDSIKEYQESISVAGLFEKYAEDFYFFGDMQNYTYTLLLQTKDIRQVLQYLGFLIWADMEEDEETYSVIESDNYGIAYKGKSIVEISNDPVWVDGKILPKHLEAPTFAALHPEWVERLRNFPEGVSLALFYQDQYSLLSGFTSEGHLKLSLQMQQEFILGSWKRLQLEKEFEKITKTYEEIFYYLYDRINQQEGTDFELLKENAENYLEFPDFFPRFHISTQETEDSLLYFITYGYPLPEGFSNVELVSALDYTAQSYELNLEIIDEQVTILYRVPKE